MLIEPSVWTELLLARATVTIRPRDASLPAPPQGAATWGRTPEEAIRHLREVLGMIAAEETWK